jgi:hypothetical protein
MNAASAGKIFRGTSAVVTVSLPSRGTPVLGAVTGLFLPQGHEPLHQRLTTLSCEVAPK